MKNGLKLLFQSAFSLCAVTPMSVAEDCFALTEPSASAKEWLVEQVDDDLWKDGPEMVGVEHYFHVARSESRPNLTVPLPLYGSGGVWVLGFETLPRYQNRIGLLRYYAGSAGTKVVANFYVAMVIDLKSGRVYGSAPVVTTVGDDCEIAEWTWSENGLVVDDQNHARFEFEF